MRERGLLIAGVVFLAGVTVGAAMVAPTGARPVPCLPTAAVDYDGVGVWYDGAGRAVALAEFEDSLDWCVK